MRHILQYLLVTCVLYIQWVAAAPGGIAAVGAVGIAKPPITIGGGDVGVDFGGYHASAGLGGAAGGGATGGLHAEAGTPYGHEAVAGLGGVAAGGGASGGLYAAADSGAGAEAGAAIGGTKTVSGSFGGSISAAHSGGSYVSKTVTYEKPVVVEETVHHEAPKAEKTYIERTVIPNYVEKTVQVPSYVEKTIRVPTVVEKKVKVPAPPTIIEKTVKSAPAEVSHEFEAGGGAEVTYVNNVRPVVRKHWTYRKPIFGGFFAGGAVGGGSVGAGSYGGGYGSGYGTGYSSGYGGSGGTATYTYRKSVDGTRLVDDIFNIPISTLGAVSKLVGGLAGGASGSVSVSKSVSAY